MVKERERFMNENVSRNSYKHVHLWYGKVCRSRKRERKEKGRKTLVIRVPNYVMCGGNFFHRVSHSLVSQMTLVASRCVFVHDMCIVRHYLTLCVFFGFWNVFSDASWVAGKQTTRKQEKIVKKRREGFGKKIRKKKVWKEVRRKKKGSWISGSLLTDPVPGKRVVD